MEKLRVGDGRAGVLRQAGDEVQIEQVEFAFALTFEDDHADHLVRAEQRHRKLRHAAGQRFFIIRVDLYIRDQRGLRRTDHAPNHGPIIREDSGLVLVQQCATRVAIGRDDMQLAAFTVAHQHRPGRCAALAHGPFHRNIDHVFQAEGAVKLLVDALHGVEFLHAQGKLLVSHIEQARVFDGNSGLSREGFEQVGIFLHEDAAVGLVQALQHADRPPADHQRHGQDRAGTETIIAGIGQFHHPNRGLLLTVVTDTERFFFVGGTDVPEPARVTGRIIDDDR